MSEVDSMDRKGYNWLGVVEVQVRVYLKKLYVSNQHGKSRFILEYSNN